MPAQIVTTRAFREGHVAGSAWTLTLRLQSSDNIVSGITNNEL
jgi:hypothetical protein